MRGRHLLKFISSPLYTLVIQLPKRDSAFLSPEHSRLLISTHGVSTPKGYSLRLGNKVLPKCAVQIADMLTKSGDIADCGPVLP